MSTPAKRGRPATGRTPDKDRKAKSRASLEQAGGHQLNCALTDQGAADLVEVMGREGVGQTEAVHRALRHFVECGEAPIVRPSRARK